MSTSAPTRNSPTMRANSAVAAAAKALFFVSAVGASAQSSQLHSQLRIACEHISFPVSTRRDPRREKFRLLAQQWRTETHLLSSTTEIAMNPAYQAIIGMGPEALPMILDDLRRNSGHWYWALKAISNEDPVLPRDRGYIKKMKSAWLQWGETKGLVDA